MFVDLMSDIYNTFSEGFLKAQLRFDSPEPPAAAPPPKPTKRYGATGILEEIPADAPKGAVDIGPSEPLTSRPAARPDPVVIGAGKVRSFDQPSGGGSTDWSSVGRNDPCPCGSGKKFKKCHGATL
jgi:preprotein translocase subunit SecA